MINLDNLTREKNKKHNEKWPYIPDHPYRILIIGVSGSGKTNTKLNLLKEQDVIDKIYLYAKDLNEPKYEFLIKKPENVGIKHCNNPNAFIKFQIQWIMFTKILLIITQTGKEKFQLF